MLKTESAPIDLNSFPHSSSYILFWHCARDIPFASIMVQLDCRIAKNTRNQMATWAELRNGYQLHSSAPLSRFKPSSAICDPDLTPSLVREQFDPLSLVHLLHTWQKLCRR
jgi:hypothetical protein